MQGILTVYENAVFVCPVIVQYVLIFNLALSVIFVYVIFVLF